MSLPKNPRTLGRGEVSKADDITKHNRPMSDESIDKLEALRIAIENDEPIPVNPKWEVILQKIGEEEPRLCSGEECPHVQLWKRLATEYKKVLIENRKLKNGGKV